MVGVFVFFILERFGKESKFGLGIFLGRVGRVGVMLSFRFYGRGGGVGFVVS